jgi:hypothetical protein
MEKKVMKIIELSIKGVVVLCADLYKQESNYFNKKAALPDGFLFFF